MENDLQAKMVTSLKRGDPGAFAPLYDAYSPMIYGLIIRIVQDPKEAENLTQETFIKIWHKIDLYDPEKGKFSTWVINIARNTAIDFTKSTYYLQNKNHESIYLVGNENDHPIINPELDSVDLRKHVSVLDEPYRKIIELMYFEGFTQNEISEKFNIPIGTVKTRARVAIQKLRAFYIF